jgi:hypothetical protein
VDPTPPWWHDGPVLRRQPHPRARAWLTPLAFVLSLLLTLGAFAHRADAQAFKPRSRNGVAAKSPFKKAPAAEKAKAAAPGKTPARTAATTPSKTSTPAKRIVAKKAPPAKKKGKATDDDVVVVDDDDEEEEDEDE